MPNELSFAAERNAFVVYRGAFNPPTNGHLRTIINTFEEVENVIFKNYSK
jgi:phosphopantetheine adenylyltransferase